MRGAEGPMGLTGPPGPEGEIGPEGAKGELGEQGEPVSLKQMLILMEIVSVYHKFSRQLFFFL